MKRSDPRMTQSSGSVTIVQNPTATVSQRQTVCRVDSDNVGPWKVTLGAPQVNNFNQVTLAPGGEAGPSVNYGTAVPSARITWGAQGATFIANVDWGQGSAFVVNGSYVQVELNPEVLGGGTSGVSNVVFPAQISPAVLGNLPPTSPTLTKRTPILDPSGGAVDIWNMQIPDYARSYYLLYADGPPGQTVELYQRSGNGLTQYRADQLGASAARTLLDYAHPIMIAPGSRVLVIRNGPGAVNPATFEVIFNLDLG